MPKLDRLPIKTRWVICNKGDFEKPDIRCRLVAMEVKYIKGIGGMDASLFSATPPIEAFKALISIAASDKKNILGQIDIQKTHLYGKSKRKIAIILPKECGENPGYGFLNRTLYGTRDAASSWELEVRETLESFGMTAGSSCPCLYSDRSRDIALLVHGDDIIFCGAPEHFSALSARLKDEWNLSVKGTLGPLGDSRSLRVLGRLLSFQGDAYEVEADPRHAELLCRLVTKKVSSPGEKVDLVLEDETPLDESGISDYRSLVMRAAYLGLDRPDICFSVVRCARAMCNPTQQDMIRLMRIARYLKEKPRIVQRFKFQALPTVLTVECDSDFAGCQRTRKSTSGFVAMLGAHNISAVCKTQSVIALSSGEAEFYSVGGAVMRALGLRSNLSDLGVDVRIILYTDSTAAKGTAFRKGLGKAKHIDTVYLWLQDIFKDKEVELHKVDGEKNRSDLLTKYLAGPKIAQLLKSMGYSARDGRHELALTAAD